MEKINFLKNYFDVIQTSCMAQIRKFMINIDNQNGKIILLCL